MNITVSVSVMGKRGAFLHIIQKAEFFSNSNLNISNLPTLKKGESCRMKNLIYVIAVLLVGMLTCNVNNVIYAGDDAEAKKKETVAQEAQEVSLTGVIVKQEVTRKKGDEEQKYNLFFLQTDDGNKIALSDKVAKEANLDLTQAEGKKYTLQAQAVVKKTKEGKNHITIVKINQATCADAPATTPAPAQ